MIWNDCLKRTDLILLLSPNSCFQVNTPYIVDLMTRLWVIHVWCKCTQLHKNSPIDPKCLWWESGFAWGGKTWLPTAICSVCGVSFDAVCVNKTCHTPNTFGNHNVRIGQVFCSFVYRGKPCYIPTKNGLREPNTSKNFIFFVCVCSNLHA